MAELIPVSQWIYTLFKVDFWTKTPAEGGHLIRSIHLTSHSDHPYEVDCNEYAPSHCEWYEWSVVKENVGHPRVIGSIHGMPLHESPRSHADWVLSKM